MLVSPRPEVRRLEPAAHGALSPAEAVAMGMDPGQVLDFSVNTNPFGPPPGLREALADTPFERYPDSQCLALRQALAGHLGFGVAQLWVGSGSVELVRLATLAYLSPGDRALILGPTFGEYQVAAQLMGAEVHLVRAEEREGFRPPLDRVLPLAHHLRPKMLFLCNPNNPTGHYLSPSEVRALVAACPDTLVVLDEAYVGFVPEAWSSPALLAEHPNLLILRSLTKDYALAGLRLGYAMGSEGVIAHLGRVCPPWNVNVLAQRAGLFVLGCGEWLAQTIPQVWSASRFLAQALRDLGLRVLPSSVPFFLVEVGEAAAFRAALLRRGCALRDCTSFGLSHLVRIAPRTLPECQRLVAAVQEVLAGDPAVAGAPRRNGLE